MSSTGEQQPWAIPTKTNVVIFLMVVPTTWALLWTASHASVGWAVAAAVAFAFVNMTPFSLLHEAVHKTFSRNRFWNECFGVLAAATFPTSFVMQRVAHLGHHRRNRTDADLHDYYLPHEKKWWRDARLIGGNLLGIYWFCIPFSNLVFLLTPWIYRSEWFIQGLGRRLGFEPYVREITQHASITRVWFECLLGAGYFVGVWFLLDLNWVGWLMCYGLCAMDWSSLQYVDHAWSKRDVVDGAWNLKVSLPVRLCALNYHCHLAHHRAPQVPWIHLPKLVDPAEPNPTFWSIYFSLWKGTRPAPPMEPKPRADEAEAAAV